MWFALHPSLPCRLDADVVTEETFYKETVPATNEAQTGEVSAPGRTLPRVVVRERLPLMNNRWGGGGFAIVGDASGVVLRLCSSFAA